VRGTPWAVVALVVGAGIVAAFQVGKVPVALPSLRAELGMGLAAGAWVLSIFNVVGVAVGMIMGAAIAQAGPRRVVLAGLLVMALSGLAGAAAGSAAPLLLSRFFEGVGFLMVIVSAPTLVAALAAPSDVKLAFGLWGAYMPTGQAIVMVLSPGLLAAAGWRGLWVANSALLVLYAAALAWATRHVRLAARPQGGSLWRDLRTVATAPGPLCLAFAFATYSGQYLAVAGFLPTIYIEREGLSTGTAGLLTAGVLAANAVGNLAAGALLHRGMPRWALVAAASATMGLCELGIYAAGVPLALAYGLALAFSCVGGMLPATVLGAAPGFAPAQRLVPVANGLLVQGSNLGQVAGPPTVGALADATGGWSASPMILSSLAFLGVGAAWLLRRIEQRRGG
jgi:predicted MFS family arabinose efflux permease